MGEEITVGLSAMKRATTVGTQMARLHGAVDGVDLPCAGFAVNFPTEKIFQLDGKPREDFVPSVFVDMLIAHPVPGHNPILAAGIPALQAQITP